MLVTVEAVVDQVARGGRGRRHRVERARLDELTVTDLRDRDGRAVAVGGGLVLRAEPVAVAVLVDLAGVDVGLGQV